MEETVVSFKSKNRTVSYYFQVAEDGALEIQGSISPDLEEGVQYNELTLTLSHLFMEAVKSVFSEKEDAEPAIITTD